MAYQSLYRTWRPRRFTEMVGQEPVVRALSNQAATGRVAHAYLFCGSRGTGKTSAARIMAMAINCLSPQDGNPCLACDSCAALGGDTTLDVFEMDAASNSRVEEIREMLSRTDYPPQFVRYKVYIIDEVHMLSNAAFNALLKTLEEPPPYMVFILATTEPQKLPATILSRCQRFDFGRISEKDIIGRLKQALGNDLKAEDGALQLIAAMAEGSMRDAWSLLDMCLGGAGETLTEEQARETLGAVSQSFLFEFLDALLSGDAGEALQLSNHLMQSGRDVQVFLRELGGHLRQVLAVHWTRAGIRDTTPDQLRRLQRQADSADPDQMLSILEQCMQAETDARWAASPRAVLELFVLRTCRGPSKRAAPSLKPGSRENKEAAPQPAELPSAEDPSAADGEKEGMPMRQEDTTALPAPPPPAPEAVPLPPEPAMETVQAEPGRAADAPEIPLMQAAAAEPGARTPAASPRDAWNAMLKRLAREHEGLHALVSRGKYGGYEDGTFLLRLEKEDDILATLLSDEEREKPISLILSEEMGLPCRFSTGGKAREPHQAPREADDGNVEALAKVFGREKIILRKDNP